MVNSSQTRGGKRAVGTADEGGSPSLKRHRSTTNQPQGQTGTEAQDLPIVLDSTMLDMIHKVKNQGQWATTIAKATLSQTFFTSPSLSVSMRNNIVDAIVSPRWSNSASNIAQAKKSFNSTYYNNQNFLRAGIIKIGETWLTNTDAGKHWREELKARASNTVVNNETSGVLMSSDGPKSIEDLFEYNGHKGMQWSLLNTIGFCSKFLVHVETAPAPEGMISWLACDEDLSIHNNIYSMILGGVLTYVQAVGPFPNSFKANILTDFFDSLEWNVPAEKRPSIRSVPLPDSGDKGLQPFVKSNIPDGFNTYSAATMDQQTFEINSDDEDSVQDSGHPYNVAKSFGLLTYDETRALESEPITIEDDNDSQETLTSRNGMASHLESKFDSVEQSADAFRSEIDENGNNNLRRLGLYGGSILIASAPGAGRISPDLAAPWALRMSSLDIIGQVQMMEYMVQQEKQISFDKMWRLKQELNGLDAVVETLNKAKSELLAQKAFTEEFQRKIAAKSMEIRGLKATVGDLRSSITTPQQNSLAGLSAATISGGTSFKDMYESGGFSSVGLMPFSAHDDHQRSRSFNNTSSTVQAQGQANGASQNPVSHTPPTSPLSESSKPQNSQNSQAMGFPGGLPNPTTV